MIDLVIFTCQGREHLLRQSFSSFKDACDFKFNKIILAIDGPIDGSIISLINPDIVIQHTNRGGYVNNIAQALKLINAPYFFWLEDDWTFHQKIPVEHFFQILNKHPDWAEIVFSKTGPLGTDAKTQSFGDDLYQTNFGFSANPCFCHTGHLQAAFKLLEHAPKGDKLGEDGFENFLSRNFEHKNIKCVIADPVNHFPISHEGYLESTPRNWHMTNSMQARTVNHLLTIPAPSVGRKLLMTVKLFSAFCLLAIKQLTSNKVYELCFRIISSAKTISKDD